MNQLNTHSLNVSSIHDSLRLTLSGPDAVQVSTQNQLQQVREKKSARSNTGNSLPRIDLVLIQGIGLALISPLMPIVALMWIIKWLDDNPAFDDQIRL
jgi:lipopolysaccharide/colanic/teichoic acid biosynthesis glycosyltransferase